MLKAYKLAEGGHFGYEDPDMDFNIDEDDDDEKEVNRTHPFQPGAVSTPYQGGEQHEIQTMQHEHSGLPDTSCYETPLLGDLLQPEERQGNLDSALDLIKKSFPRVDFKKLGPIGHCKKGVQADIVSFGPKGGETQIFKKDGSGLLKSFTERFSKSLGQSAKQIIAEDRDTIQEQDQRLEEAEKQQREAETIAAEKEKELQEMEKLKQQTERAQAKIDAIQEKHGTNLESETELRRG